METILANPLSDGLQPKRQAVVETFCANVSPGHFRLHNLPLDYDLRYVTSLVSYVFCFSIDLYRNCPAFLMQNFN